MKKQLNTVNVIDLIRSDWNRYLKLHKKINFIIFLAVLFHNPGMSFSAFYRIEKYLFTSNNFVLKKLGNIGYPFYFILTYFILDIDISPKVTIGEGLYIHNKGIILAESVTCGKNLTLIGPVTIGVKGFGGNKKAAKIGNNVIIFSGAKVIGDIKIGNGVVVGANAVVVKDTKDNVVIGGVPAKILKHI